MSPKNAMGLLGVLGGGTLLNACQGASGSAIPATTAAASPSAGGFNRSNILSNLDGSSTQTGVLLSLTITIVDTEKSCSAMQGVQIDIWHCNATGC
jgi:protocatechuate 3,4-dioxygenase beta subunit